MKPTGKPAILTNSVLPVILMSHEEISTINRIVEKAPKEAQWFHRLERIECKNALVYRVYETFVPEQYCSAAEVESTPEMMVKLYRELLGKYGNEKTNEITSSLTVWCHSHGPMGTSPSGQDLKQFKEQVDNALKLNQQDPQIMLIFNKSEEYYSRAFDPKLGLGYEHVQVIVGGYDFTTLDLELKEKFKVKPMRQFSPGTQNNWGTEAMRVQQGGYSRDFHDWMDLADKSVLPTKKKEKPHQKALKKPVGSPYKKLKPNTPMSVYTIQDEVTDILDQINGSGKLTPGLTDKLIEVLGRVINPPDYIALEELLNGDPETIRKLSWQGWIEQENDEVQQEAIIQFYQDVDEGLMDSTLLLEAIRTIIHMKRANTVKQAVSILEHWLKFVDEYIGDFTPPTSEKPLTS